MTSRREHPRYAIELDVSILSSESEIAGRTNNLSRGGLCMLAGKAIPVSTACRVRIALVFPENRLSERLEIPGTVVWCTPVGSAQQIGIKFAPTDAQGRQYLDLFIKFLDETDRPEDEDP